MQSGSTDGVTNMFIGLCDAMGNGRNIHADVDGELIYTMYVV